MKGKKMLGILMGLICVMGSTNAAAQEIKVYMNGGQLSLQQPLFVEKGITYVPVRAISEAMGAKVSWHDTFVDIKISEDRYAGCEIGTKKAYTKEGELTLEGAARAKNNTTYVPLRFVSEALGAEVNYQSGRIDIASNKENAAKNNSNQQTKPEVQKENDEYAAPGSHSTANARYTADGVYDEDSHQWIYTLADNNGGIFQTVIYNMDSKTWSLMSDEEALKQSEYAKYFCPGNIQYLRNYKDHTLTEDFDYQYKKGQAADALFWMTFSEQKAQYYSGWGLFSIDLQNGKIKCLRKPLEENKVKDEEAYYIRKEEIAPAVHEPRMPKLPSDLDLHKLPVVTMTLKTAYHAELAASGKTKKVIAAYEKDGQDFVALKDVQSLISGITFNQSADGVRTLGYQGKKAVLTKEDYSVLDVSNKLMISNKVLSDMGINIEVKYILGNL